MNGAEVLGRDGAVVGAERTLLRGEAVWNKVTPVCAETRIVDAAEGRVACDPPRKKVCIMGFASSSRDYAPFEDPEYEIWGLNQLQPHIARRADRWFEMHRPEVFTADIVRDTDYVDWLAKSPIPVYMITVYPAVPNAVRYPIERVIKHFGIDPPYLTSTPAQMAALAIMEGFTTIAFYGIDLVVGIEYQEQKPCMEFYIGWALARDIEVIKPISSALLKSRYVYGYQVATAPGPLTIQTVGARIEALTERREAALTRLNNLDGAILEYGHVILPWTTAAETDLQTAKAPGGDAVGPEALRTRAKFLQDKQEEIHTAVNQLDGAIAELKGSVLHVLDLYEKGVG